jgi:tRNA-binding EMAP/Myf-like protein
MAICFCSPSNFSVFDNVETLIKIKTDSCFLTGHIKTLLGKNMIDQLDMRYGKVFEIKPFSEKTDSPRRKFCIIKIEFPDIGIVKQSVGQFAHHRTDMLGKTVLCLTNLASKNMFGQVSEVLVLGVSHPDGGVIPGDTQEAQATYLQPIHPIQFANKCVPKSLVPFDVWLTQEFRLAEVLRQSAEILKVRVDNESWTVPLITPLKMTIEGQHLIVARHPENPMQGRLPYSAQGEPMLAQPCDGRTRIGLKVF